MSPQLMYQLDVLVLRRPFVVIAMNDCCASLCCVKRGRLECSNCVDLVAEACVTSQSSNLTENAWQQGRVKP